MGAHDACLMHEGGQRVCLDHRYMFEGEHSENRCLMKSGSEQGNELRVQILCRQGHQAAGGITVATGFTAQVRSSLCTASAEIQVTLVPVFPPSDSEQPHTSSR